MVDVESQLTAVAREVVSEDVDGFPSRVQTLAQLLPVAVAELWSAVTDSEQITRWFAPVSGELRLGGHYRIEGKANGEVQECAPPANDTAHYKITWEVGGAISWVTVRLEQVDALVTRLELEHVARTEEVPDPLWERYGPASTGVGWDQALLGLSLYLSEPDAPQPGDPLGWAAGPEGRQFSRGSADAWALAHIADGAEPETAQAAADATFALYSGESDAASSGS